MPTPLAERVTEPSRPLFPLSLSVQAPPVAVGGEGGRNFKVFLLRLVMRRAQGALYGGVQRQVALLSYVSTSGSSPFSASSA